MRIAYVITRADAVGGASVHVRDVAGCMLARGHEVLVLLGGEGPVSDFLARAGIPYRPLRFLRRAVHPVADLRALVELTAELSRYRPHLVSTHTAKAGWIGRAAGARLGIPVVHTPHGWPMGDRMPPPQAFFFRAAERAAAGWANAIVCVCEYERRLALAHRVVRPEQPRVVLNGVADVPAGLRADPARTPVRIVSVARFEPPKDHPVLLQALARLRHLDWELDLVGGGPLEPASRVLAERLQIASRVRFLGDLAEVAPVLARAQVFALASRSEALPRSVLEAMRAGLPVVASEVGGIPEAVDNGVNGLLVPRSDPERLAVALGTVLSDPALRQRLGTVARLIYDARFRLEHMVEKTVSIYESLWTPDATA